MYWGHYLTAQSSNHLNRLRLSSVKRCMKRSPTRMTKTEGNDNVLTLKGDESVCRYNEKTCRKPLRVERTRDSETTRLLGLRSHFPQEGFLAWRIGMPYRKMSLNECLMSIR